ncbi:MULTISPECIES: hypothetical protein [unclassified Pseudomonas]|uniref:hypothetical protein n=1 Tax=unclassified Pseudomonas TaxID=196821 RepID=UPI0030DBC5F6
MSKRLSGKGTVFHYLVDGDAISITYQGARVRFGQQSGRSTLSVVWGWLSGTTGGGESSYVELAECDNHS